MYTPKGSKQKFTMTLTNFPDTNTYIVNQNTNNQNQKKPPSLSKDLKMVGEKNGMHGHTFACTIVHFA